MFAFNFDVENIEGKMLCGGKMEVVMWRSKKGQRLI